MDIVHLQQVISEAYREREQASRPEVRAAVEETIALLDRGAIRVAENRLPRDFSGAAH